MASYSGRQYPGAARDLKALKRQEAEMRNSAYRERLAAATTEEVPAN